MKLSIIIVNWNTADLTRQALSSFFTHTHFKDIEVIVVDNNSADESVDMIRREFPGVRLLVNTDNLGFAKANNQGMKIATGEYIMLLNSDTITKDGAIDELVRYLDTHTDTMMVGPRLLNADETFQHACRRSLPTPANSFFHLFGFTKMFSKNKAVNAYKKYADDPNVTEPVEALSGAGMMFRRTVYEKIGGLDERFFMYGEDLDFCKRVRDNGWKTVYVADAKIIHLGGGSSKKRRRASLVDFYDAMWLYYQKHFQTMHSKFFQKFVRFGIETRKRIALIQNAFKPS